MAEIAAVVASTHHPFHHWASDAAGVDRPPTPRAKDFARPYPEIAT